MNWIFFTSTLPTFTRRESWGDYNKAIEYLQLSLEDNPENDVALYEIAFCWIHGPSRDSISFYERFIDKQPYSYAAWYNLGNVLNRMDRFEEALDAYDYCLAIRTTSRRPISIKQTLASLNRFPGSH